MSENFYHTVFKYHDILPYVPCGMQKTIEKASRLACIFEDLLMQGMRPSGIIRGCIAIKSDEPFDRINSFAISKRSKHSLNQIVFVDRVDHVSRTVEVINTEKASLNAPLIDWIFRKVPWAHAIIHWHGKPDENVIYSMLSYHDPGSVQDSQRRLDFMLDGSNRNFCIINHGFFKVLSEEECKSILK